MVGHDQLVEKAFHFMYGSRQTEHYNMVAWFDFGHATYQLTLAIAYESGYGHVV